MPKTELHDVLIIGGGLAGLSAAVYLGRSRRDTLLVHSNRSMAKWEADAQNYLGFPEGIDGNELLRLGQAQVTRFHVGLVEDDIASLKKIGDGTFRAQGGLHTYAARRVLVATGLTHLPPEIPGVKDCLGKSLFFCKDCDAFRVQGQRIVIIGHGNEAADYALAMLLYSPSVIIATNGTEPHWDADHAGWLSEYRVLVRRERICEVKHEEGQLQGFTFDQGERISVDAAFTTRGDIYHSGLAEGAGASLDDSGEIIIDAHLNTTVPGLYAAGCVTSANCQMIIAAGQGATAAQAINRDLFEECLREHRLPCFGTPLPDGAAGTH
ncbi:MAG: NAD(P)/FAD-dependent oxidoreductase [Nitrospira sp.]|nr:NAD(P)/FAD-dependent oxidoreductase [Nitrospira sp.]